MQPFTLPVPLLRQLLQFLPQRPEDLVPDMNKSSVPQPDMRTEVRSVRKFLLHELLSAPHDLLRERKAFLYGLQLGFHDLVSQRCSDVHMELHMFVHSGEEASEGQKKSLAGFRSGAQSLHDVLSDDPSIMARLGVHQACPIGHIRIVPKLLHKLMLHEFSSEVALAIGPDRCGTVVLHVVYQTGTHSRGGK